MRINSLYDNLQIVKISCHIVLTNDYSINKLAFDLKKCRIRPGRT